MSWLIIWYPKKLALNTVTSAPAMKSLYRPFCQLKTINSFCKGLHVLTIFQKLLMIKATLILKKCNSDFLNQQKVQLNSDVTLLCIALFKNTTATQFPP